MNRTALAQRIKTLPGLTDTERADLLTLLNEEKTYGLTWEEKPEQVEEDLRANLPVLREVTDRRIVAKPTTKPAENANPAPAAASNQLAIDLTNTGSESLDA